MAFSTGRGRQSFAKNCQMKFFVFAVGFLWANSAAAQTPSVDTSYHLFWFQGRKLAPNRLLTPQRDTVVYLPAKGILRFSARRGSGNKLAAMEAELARTPQRIGETIARLSAALPKKYSPFLSQPVQEAYAEVAGQWKQMIKPELQLPEGPFHAEKPAARPVKGGPFYEEPLDDFEAQVEAFMKEMEDYVAKRKSDPPRPLPTPPKADLGYCQPCNGVAEAQLQKEIDAFEEAFWSEDRDMLQKLLGVSRQVHIMGSEALRKKFVAVYDPFFDFFEAHYVDRARQLLERYVDDPEYHEAIFPVALGIERQRQLMGLGKHRESLLDLITDRSIIAVDAYLQKASARYDYRIMLNARFILGVERQRQLMGTAKGVNPLQRYLDFNKFKLNINVSTRFGGTDPKTGDFCYIISQLRGDNYFAAVPQEDCTLKWVLLGPDERSMKFNLLAGEIEGSLPVTYLGTKKWETEKPLFNIDFCRQDGDTVEVPAFHPEGHKEVWQYPAPIGVQNYPNIHAGLTACFLDLEKAKSIDPAKVEAMKKQMMAKYQQFMKQSNGLRGKDPSKMTAAEMARMAKAIQSSDDLVDMAVSPNPLNFEVKGNAANGSKIVLKERLNGKEIFPNNPTIVYAWFHLQLEQDSGAPFSISLQ